MASTLTAVDILGLYDGFVDGIGGSLSPELLTGETDAVLVTGLTANRISWAVVGDHVAALSGLTHIKVDGVDYPVTSGPTFNSPNTDTEFGPISDLTPGTYTVALVGVGGDTTAPTITSSSSIAIAERTKLAHALTANEAVTWSLVGGADQADFELSGSTLRWASDTIRFYDAPADADTNNTYVVTVRATDGASNTTDQTITATVSAGAVSVKIGFGQTENSLRGGSAAWDTANAGPILLADYFAAAPTSVTGTLAATESGSDTAAIAGKVAVQGTLAATESGADVAAITGTTVAPGVTGTLAATETGSDTAAIAGNIPVTGALDANEAGSDTASLAGVVPIRGTLAGVESGADTSTIAGKVAIQGSLSATESGNDTVSFSGVVPVIGALACVEAGADTASASGSVLVSGSLAATESGADTASFAGIVPVFGALAAVETGQDVAWFTNHSIVTSWTDYVIPAPITGWTDYEKPRPVLAWTNEAIPAPITGWIDYERPRPVTEWTAMAIAPPVSGWVDYRIAD